MNLCTRALTTTVLTLLALNAQAAPMTHQVEAGGPFSEVTASWDVSPLGLSFLNASDVIVKGMEGATIASQLNARFKYTQLAVHDLQLTSFTYEDTTGQLLNASFNGGVHFDRIDDGIPENIGEMSLNNFRVNLASGEVVATIQGSAWLSEVFTPTDVTLWRLDNASGQVGFGQFEMSLPSLTMTQEGFDAMSSALGLLEDNKSALSRVTSFGTVTAVPEPGTYMLMAIGLVACWAASRRRHAPD